MSKTEALEFLSFVKACVNWDPQQRSSPTTLLKHRWLNSGTAAPGSVQRESSPRLSQHDSWHQK